MQAREHGNRWQPRALLAAFVLLCTPIAFAGHGDRIKPKASAASIMSPNPDCSLSVPPDPLSAKGLATPCARPGRSGTDGAGSGVE